jgi:hypothetical protein
MSVILDLLVSGGKADYHAGESTRGPGERR